jgi:hypothetical protein
LGPHPVRHKVSLGVIERGYEEQGEAPKSLEKIGNLFHFLSFFTVLLMICFISFLEGILVGSLSLKAELTSRSIIS